MTSEQFIRESDYGAVMAVARAMLNQGCISTKEYRKIGAYFLRKYNPVIGALRANSP